MEKLWRFCKRKPALSSLAAAALLLLLIVAIGSPITAWRIRKSELTLAENLYAADMKLVELSVAEGNWGRARSLLSLTFLRLDPKICADLSGAISSNWRREIS